MTACAQPGCGGTIQDGYCDTCGLAAAAPVPDGQSSRSRSRRTSGRSARGRLGAGLVEIPPVPYRDPASAVLANPQVPENKRYCSGCDQPVGRATDGSGLRPGLTEGFCLAGSFASTLYGSVLTFPGGHAVRKKCGFTSGLKGRSARRVDLMANAIRPRTLT